MTFKLFSGKRKTFKACKKIKEIVSMQEVLLQTSSFKSFCKYNEVFDMNKQTMITKKSHLYRVYANGIEVNSPHLILNKN